MLLRQSNIDDLDEIVRIAEEGKRFLRANGVHQWQSGTYPSRELFISDIEHGIGYVLTEGDTICAICAITFEEEPAYRKLESGAWLTSGAYATIHRCAVAPEFRGRGIVGILFDCVSNLAAERDIKSVRIDTHPDNRFMRSALAKASFVQCGELRLMRCDEAGALRIGYERIVK